jgi:ABC-2 type transport system permease protein
MTGVLAGFQILLAALASWLRSQSGFSQLEGLVPPDVRQLMGQSLVTMLSVSGIVALGYFHTAIEAALVALVLVIGSEPADELDAGFVDLALSRPIARQALLARTLILMVSCPALVVGAMGLGTAVGARWVMPVSMAGPAPRLVLSLMLNLWALLMAWGGLAMAVAAASRKRSQVTSVVALAALAALLVDYLARAWTPIQRLAWLSPFHYFSPLDLVIGTSLAARDLAVLLGIGASGVLAAFVIYARRDL